MPRINLLGLYCIYEFLYSLDVLLDDESRRLIALQQKLEEETEKARLLQLKLQHEVVQ